MKRRDDSSKKCTYGRQEDEETLAKGTKKKGIFMGIDYF